MGNRAHPLISPRIENASEISLVSSPRVSNAPSSSNDSQVNLLTSSKVAIAESPSGKSARNFFLNAPVELRKRIILRWIPLIFRAGAMPALAQRHLEELYEILDVSAHVSFLPGRAIFTWLGEKKMPTPPSAPYHASVDMESSMTDLRMDMSFLEDRTEEPVALGVVARFGFNFKMMQELEALLARMRVDSLTVKDVFSCLDSIEHAPPLYPSWLVFIAFAFMSAPMAPAFFNGNLLDGLLALLFGAIAGFFVLAGDWYPTSFNILHEFTSAFVISLGTILCVIIYPKLAFWPISLAATIWILPGFSMVIGFMDILTKSPITGLFFHVGGLFVALTMGIAFSFGVYIPYQLMPDPKAFPRLLLESESPHVPYLGKLALCVVFALACSVIFMAPPKQWPMITISVIFVFTVMTLIEVHLPKLPNEMLNFTAAFLLALFVKIGSFFIGQVPETSIYVAMLLLVPGSRVVRSCFAVMDHIHGQPLLFLPLKSSIFASFVVAFGLVFGMILFDKVILFRRSPPK